MRKWFFNSVNITSALVLLAILIGGVYLAVKNTKPSSYLAQSQVSQGSKFKLPSGLQTYQIVEASGKEPQIVQAIIDPPDVHVGDKQTLSIIVSDPDGIASVQAITQLDHSTTTLNLNYVRVVDDSEIKPSAYSIDQDNHLVINTKLRDEQMAETKGIMPSETTLAKAMDFFKYYLKPSVAKAAPGEKLLYSASWTVQDTHDTKYHTTFVVKNTKGDVNTITLAWSDACNIPLSGAWSLGSYGNCTISSPDGVDNGVATIATYTLTLNSTFAYNSGQSISVSSGAIAIGSGGSIQKTYIWQNDADGDGYTNGTNVDQNSSPGASYKRRYTSPGIDCNDANVNVFQNVFGGTDADQDLYIVGASAATGCVGGSTVAGNTRTYYKNTSGSYTFLGSSQIVGYSDCNDSNALLYANITGAKDTDWDGYVDGASASAVCAGASALHNGRTYYYESGDTNSPSFYSLLISSNILGYNDCAITDSAGFQRLTLNRDCDRDGYITSANLNASACVGAAYSYSVRTYYNAYGGDSSCGFGHTAAYTASNLGSDCNDFNDYVYSVGGGGSDPNHDHIIAESALNGSLCVGATADNIWYNDNNGTACWIRSSQVTGFNSGETVCNSTATHGWSF